MNRVELGSNLEMQVHISKVAAAVLTSGLMAKSRGMKSLEAT
jgi:hypothetical protein